MVFIQCVLYTRCVYMYMCVCVVYTHVLVGVCMCVCVCVCVCACVCVYMRLCSFLLCVCLVCSISFHADMAQIMDNCCLAIFNRIFMCTQVVWEYSLVTNRLVHLKTSPPLYRTRMAWSQNCPLK